MKVVITGGTGFIGLALTRRLLARGKLTGPSGGPERIDRLVLFDADVPRERPAGLDSRVELVAGDVSDRDAVFGVIDRDDVSVFHLASVVSGEGERDFDLALRVNLDGGRAVLEACRAVGGRPRLVFASSIAVFGGAAMPDVVTDATKQTAQSTYGVTKAICELLVNDYTRKGYLDGRSARLPTIIIRPGAPNQAASGFASGVFREPLGGDRCVLPVALETRMPVLGYRTAVDGLIRLHEADGVAVGDDRGVNLPSLSVTVEEMIASLKRVAGDRPLGPIEVREDPEIASIVAGWPRETAFGRALALGLPRDRDLDSIVRAYVEDFLPARGSNPG